jgi:hypothetical protein
MSAGVETSPSLPPSLTPSVLPGWVGVALVLGVTRAGVTFRGEVREDADAMPVPIRRPVRRQGEGRHAS